MREQPPPICPANRQWGWSGVVMALALFSSLAWYLFWVAMAAVELDIRHIVDWYFFAKFNLTEVPRTYEGLESVGYWTPLFVFAIFLASCLVCPCRTYLGKVPPIIYMAVALYNVLLFVLMIHSGQKILSLFHVVFPVQLVFQIHNLWWLLLLGPTVLVMLSYVISCDTPNGPKLARDPASTLPLSTSSCLPFKSSVFYFILVLVLHFSLPIAIQWLTKFGCLPCEGPLPKKPSLIAHRGCGFVYPENTLLSFVHSSHIPGMIGLETDVQISYDGVPFLLHDPHTIRTTDVVSRCPQVDPLANATWLNFTSGSCPLNRLNVGSWFTQEHREVEDTESLSEFRTELLPSLEQFLSLAKERGMVVIFDVREPNVAHPFHRDYVNRTLSAVRASGINHNKVWWLCPQERGWVISRHPHLVQVTKTEDTPFQRFREEKIRIVNDDWGTPLKTIREYQAANLSVNLFFVDSQFAFNYAWCVGAHSVTTNNCKQLSALSENRFYQVCSSLNQSLEHQLWPLSFTFFLCSVSCLTCFECMQRLKRKKQTE